MDVNEIQVNCGRCGKSLIVRLEDVQDKRWVECADCARLVEPKKVPRLVRDTNPSS
jgi:DNA-directed RNA polymerase subunit RPC12/RpoP